VDRRTTQNPSVRAWATRQRARKLMISVITVLEVEIGVCRLKWRDPAQRPMLRLAGA
jgi:predicted nucleic acid-binding protein